MSIFDTPEFNERLFFPREDLTSPPDGAIDLDIEGLHVRRYAATAGRPTLLLFHGNGEVVSDYDDQAEMFAAAGANLAVMDYRGYGGSTGTPTLRGMLADARLVCEAVKPQLVMGRSLGAACAAELYGRSDVDGFILESGFVELDGLIRRRGLEPPVLSADDLATFDPLPKLARGRTRLLLLHGERDTMIAPREAERAYATAGTSDKTLALVPGRGHNDVSLSDVYWTALARFVEQCR